MGALEVEALAVAVDPVHVMMVVRLTYRCGQQRQRQHQQSSIHVEEISSSAAPSSQLPQYKLL